MATMTSNMTLGSIKSMVQRKDQSGKLKSGSDPGRLTGVNVRIPFGFSDLVKHGQITCTLRLNWKCFHTLVLPKRRENHPSDPVIPPLVTQGT